MTESKKSKARAERPDYVMDLEAAYGPPSEEGFGAAVFFETLAQDAELEEAAKAQYQHFVGKLWEQWGEEAWMTPWKEVYARKAGQKRDVVKELKGIEDDAAAISVPLVIELMDDPDAALAALSAAYDDPDVADFRVYTIGDGEAMSGLLLAGQRENGEATFLATLMD